MTFIALKLKGSGGAYLFGVALAFLFDVLVLGLAVYWLRVLTAA